ncbi:MAG: hypothetical protein N3E36_02620 [Sulfolobales archaeon]|nr:hypothetical protein [Sulfolobales archaeon]MCX8198909.1 hypothetical protein [Sulfolobales archaeon]MDW8169887.1 hypothetical protein [Desulfurococcaceae archaeon]
MSQKQSTTSTTKSKELKIVTKYVATLDDVKSDLRKLKVLYIISFFNDISEKALQHLIYSMKEDGYQLYQDFMMISGVPFSKALKNDLTILLYVGLLETNVKRKLSLTSLGKETLRECMEKVPSIDKDSISKLVNELKPKIALIDAEVELMFRGAKRRRPK